MNRTLRRLAVAAGLLIAAAAALPVGASGPADSAADAARSWRSDVVFLEQAAQDGQTQVQGGRLALAQASDPRVKAFAQKMLDEHTQAHESLQALAARKGIELPAGPSLAQRAKLKLLQAADGATFDRRYTSQLAVEAHESTLKLFRQAPAAARDADVKAWAATTLPMLEQHLVAARTLKTQVQPNPK